MVIGILSRQNLVLSVSLNAGFVGQPLQILVENQGRINYNIANDFKGLGEVKLNNQTLLNWTLTGFPLENGTEIEDLINEINHIGNDIHDYSISKSHSVPPFSGPMIFHATFDIDADEIYDTYVNTMGWGKVYTILCDHFLRI